jgi:hypothetical protein
LNVLFFLHSLSAAVSGGVASAITNPLDMAKLRLQVHSKDCTSSWFRYTVVYSIRSTSEPIFICVSEYSSVLPFCLFALCILRAWSAAPQINRGKEATAASLQSVEHNLWDPQHFRKQPGEGGILRMLQTVYNKEGVRGLFRGAGARVREFWFIRRYN